MARLGRRNIHETYVRARVTLSGPCTNIAKCHPPKQTRSPPVPTSQLLAFREREWCTRNALPNCRAGAEGGAGGGAEQHQGSSQKACRQRPRKATLTTIRANEMGLVSCTNVRTCYPHPSRSGIRVCSRASDLLPQSGAAQSRWQQKKETG